MATFVQWVHLISAVMAVGGMGFMLFILMPSLRVLGEEARAQLVKTVMSRFRWVSWGAILLLTASGLYNISKHAWEARWGWYWGLLTLKISLAFLVFAIALLLTLPVPAFERFRAKRKTWLSISLSLAVAVILISAYLRGY